MLLEFGAKNFFSFKEGFDVSLRLGESCPDKISKGNNCSNVLAVKGANASGKTNVLKLLSFIRTFALMSFELKPSEEIGIDSFFNNDDLIEIYIVFLVGKIEYTYEVKLNDKEVISEIVYKKEKRTVKLIHREKNKFVYLNKEYKSLKIMKLRKNVSFLSLAKQYELDEVDFLCSFFESIFTNVYILGRRDDFLNDNEHEKITEYYNEDKRVFRFVKDILKRSDTGIDDIEIRSRENEETGEIIYYPIFKFRIDSKVKHLTYYDQSSGVKALYNKLFIYALVILEGGILVLDEFDINLHPDLLPMLLDFFTDIKQNKTNAQFIFTTHNSDIMNKLGKYRIVLVNKNDNESFLYRLDELPGDIIRNDRPLIPVYNSGKIGGKPRLEYAEAI